MIVAQYASAQFCTGDSRFGSEPFFTDAQISKQSNISYGSAIDWQGNTVNLRLDAYYPTLAVDTLPLRPLIMMVHGGGLVGGDKANYTRVCQEFAKRGFVALSINYRLGLSCANDTISEEKAKYRAQQDVNAALRYVAANASLLRVDTSWLFIGGGSAGSVAALGVVYLSQAEWNAFTPALAPLLGNLNSSGNTLTNTYRLRGVFNDWGAMLKASVEPSEMLPMVSFHGDADSTVIIDSSFGGGCVLVDKSYGSRALHQWLLTNGVCSDLSVAPGGGHGVFQDSVGVAFRVGRAACFFKQLFCSNCSSSYQTDSLRADCAALTSALRDPMEDSRAVYPNPFTDYINLVGIKSDERLLLFDAMGQLVYDGYALSDQNFSSLANGIYFLRNANSAPTLSRKLIKLSR